jgi:hypothetical protein
MRTVVRADKTNGAIPQLVFVGEPKTTLSRS